MKNFINRDSESPSHIKTKINFTWSEQDVLTQAEDINKQVEKIVKEKELPDRTIPNDTIIPKLKSLRLPTSKPLSITPAIRSLYTWEGIVKELYNDYFVARLTALEDNDDAEKLAEIDFQEVQSYDRNLVKPGAMFYWHLYMFIQPSGTEKNESLIRFKRAPRLTDCEISETISRAAVRVAKLSEL